MVYKLFISILIISFQLNNSSAQRSTRLIDKEMIVEFNSRGIRSIESSNDPYNASPVTASFGRPLINYKIADGDWLSHNMGNTTMSVDGKTVSYNSYIEGMPMSLDQDFIVEDGGITWNINT